MIIGRNVSLKDQNTFRIGGVADYFCEAKDVNDLKEAITFSEKNNLPVFILGGGSNILVSDKGWKGLVIKISITGIETTRKINENTFEISAGAGESWDKLVRFCVENDLYGLENLSGIPGTVGAAPIQNIGAYGSEVKDSVYKVITLDKETLLVREFLNDDCKFGHRDSFFKTKEGAKYIITQVQFILHKKDQLNVSYKDIKNHLKINNISSPTIGELREIILKIRQFKFPDLNKIGTAGSFFKNIILTEGNFEKLKKKYPLIPSFSIQNGLIKVPTAWILDKICNLKGFKMEKVGAYENQALVLVNFSDGKAENVKKLADFISDKVFEKTGITLEWEVNKVGTFT